jgi:predicted SprT family Zn-dependent metalloprotease
MSLSTKLTKAENKLKKDLSFKKEKSKTKTVPRETPILSYDKPTIGQFTALNNLFDYFNNGLFDNTLNQPMFNFSRKTKTCGFFVPNLWANAKSNALDKSKAVHEISVNPDVMKQRGAIDVFQTIVHEMCHLWQYDYNVANDLKFVGGYHDKEFAKKIESIGLMPSSTGMPNGKKTGQKMSDYLIKGGKLDLLIKKMPDHIKLPFEASPLARKESTSGKNKVKYTCPCCNTNIWGKPELNIKCTDCEESFIPN